MKRFILNLKKYGYYSIYSAICNLKAEVSGSYFNWLWWILDPFFFMLVYSFVSIIVFGKSEPYFPVFVFLGLGAWNLANRTIMSSVKGVRSNKSILSRVYVPKYMLIFSIEFENFFEYLITLALTFILAFFYHAPLTWHVLFLPLILADLLVFIFGLSCIMMHLGVYATDLTNLTQVGLKLLFYMSGIFYSIPKRVSGPYGKLLLAANPFAMIINEIRNVFLYASSPNWELLGGWFIIGLGLCALGIHLINKHEQNYVKAI